MASNACGKYSLTPGCAMPSGPPISLSSRVANIVPSCEPLNISNIFESPASALNVISPESGGQGRNGIIKRKTDESTMRARSRSYAGRHRKRWRTSTRSR